MSAENLWLVTLHVTGYGNTGVWDKMTGGNVTANLPRHRQGGQKVETVWPGLQTISDITLSRVYDNYYRNPKDQVVIAKLNKLAGTAQATVTQQPLDQNLVAFGTPRTYRGWLASVDPGDVDSTSDAERMYSVTILSVSLAN